MKKILLATTLLVGTAGFAAAEAPTFSGSATMGVGRDGDNTVVDPKNDGDFHLYNSAKLAVSMSAESDSGLSFGASFDTTVGTTYTFADDEGFDSDNGGAFGQPEVYIEGAFGKLSGKINGYNYLVNDDDDDDADLKYVYTAGGITGTVIVEEGGEYSLGGVYKTDAFSVGAAYDSFNGGANLTGSYTFGSITVSAKAENADAGGTNEVKVAYASDSISASVKVTDDSTWEVTGGYTANGITVGAKFGDASAWELTGGYDLGGGASLVGGFNSVDDAYAGVALKF